MYKSWILILYGILLFSCNGRMHIPAHPIMTDIVQPIRFSGDTAKVNLLDYCTHPENITHFFSPEDMSLVLNSAKTELCIIRHEKSLPIANLGLRYDGYRYDIPVIAIPAVENAEIPFIQGEKVDGNKLFVKKYGAVEEWFAYIQNYRIKNRNIHTTDEGVWIKIPDEAAQLEQAELRIWAGNDTMVSNGIQFRLQNGKIATADSCDKCLFSCYTLITNGICDSCCASDTDLISYLDRKYSLLKKDDLSHRDKPFIDMDTIVLNAFCCENMAARQGDFILLRNTKNTYAYLRSYLQQETIVILNNKDESVVLKLDLPDKQRTVRFKTLFGGRYSYDHSMLIIEIPGNSAEIIYN